MKLDSDLFSGIVLGALIGVKYASTLTTYFPLIVIGAVVVLFGKYLHAK